MSGHDVHRDDMFDEDPTLAAFARDLQDAAAATPAPVIGASLAAVLEGRAPVTVYPEVVETPRARVVRGPARLRWAVGAAAFAFGAGSLGVAGALPGPVQRQVARMAQVVGVDVPDGEDDAPATRTITPPTTTTSMTIPTATSIVPPVGTTVLSGQQSAGEESPDEPETPARDDGIPDRVDDGIEDDGAPENEDDSSGAGSGDLDADADADADTESSGPGSGDEDGSDELVGGAGSSDELVGDAESSDEDPVDADDLGDDAKSSEQA